MCLWVERRMAGVLLNICLLKAQEETGLVRLGPRGPAAPGASPLRCWARKSSDSQKGSLSQKLSRTHVRPAGRDLFDYRLHSPKIWLRILDY